MLLHCESIIKTYGSDKTAFKALSGISLSINTGEFCAITGPSGCGKSTLLGILGLLDKPTEGRYLFDGKDASRLNDYKRSILRREKIGFIFQSFNLLPRLSALENTALPMVYNGLSKQERKAKSEELLKKTGLAGKEKNSPLELSGGERQRVAIARALANDPLLILADEPTGNLDSASSRGIMDLLGSLHKEGKTILLVTHDPNVAACADRQIKLRDGLIE